MRSSAKEILGIDEFNKIKQKQIKEFNRLQLKMHIDLSDKKLFTLEEVDLILAKVNLDCEKIDVYNWFFKNGKTNNTLDPLDYNSFNLAEGCYYEDRKYLLYKKRGSEKCGRDCGFIIFGDEKGYFNSAFYSMFDAKEVEILLDYLELLCRNEV